MNCTVAEALYILHYSAYNASNMFSFLIKD